MNADFDRTLRCVNHYLGIGLCPVPSRMDIKGPMLASYAQHYGPVPVPESVYSDWQTTNVQILCGTKTPTRLKVCVVDLDGPEARPVWRSMCEANGFDDAGCWVSITGSGGMHLYFTCPDDLKELPGGMLWGLWDTYGDNGKGKWEKHKEIRLLADNSLVVAPPSVHVTTGARYKFEPGAGPNEVPVPKPLPAWISAMPRLGRPRFGPVEVAPYVPPAPMRRTGKYYSRDEVLDAIENKYFVAKEWGLIAAANGPNANGWLSCFMPGREDPHTSTPSGSFSVKDGTLQDRKDGVTIPLFDLGVLLGRFRDWKECRDALGDRFIGRIKRPEHPHVYKSCR